MINLVQEKIRVEIANSILPCCIIPNLFNQMIETDAKKTDITNEYTILFCPLTFISIRKNTDKQRIVSPSAIKCLTIHKCWNP